MAESKEILGLIEVFNSITKEVPLSKFSYTALCCIYIYSYDKGIIYNKDEVLYQTAKSTCESIPENKINKIMNELVTLNKEKIQDLVYYLLSGYYLEERYYGKSINEELAKLVYELLKIDGKGHIVYDMGSGNGYFLANVQKRAHDKNIILKGIVGEEINIEKAQISQMALDILNNGEQRAKIKVGNALEDFNYPYTKGFAFPPFGMKQLLSEKSRKSKLFPTIEFTNRNTSEWLFIDQMLSGICGKWTAVALVTGRTLFNDMDKDYRKLLIENGLLEGIIELPSGALSFSGIKTYLLIFSRNNKKVKLLDATNVLEETTKRFNKVKLPADKIIKLYKNKAIPSKTIDELKESQNITPSIVLMDVKKVKNGVLLSDIAEVFAGNQYTLGVFEKNGMLSEEKTGYKILTSSDIEDGTINWKKLHSIKYEDNKFDKYAVKKNDVIMTSKSSKIKIAVIDKEPDEKVIVTGGMIIMRPNTSRLDPTYLKIFLDSEQGQIVLKSIQKGITIVTINAKDLSTISIPLVNIEQQHEKAKKYNEKLSTLYVYKQEIRKIEDSLQNFFSLEYEGKD